MENDNTFVTIDNSAKFLMPLQMTWKPQKNITAYELALCMVYFNRLVMPYEVDKTEKHFRHFEIVDNNEKA